MSNLRLQKAWISALRNILRPIVRYCLKGGIALQDIVGVLKGLYVEEAAAEMERSGIKVNISRISVTTGVHRIDVRQIFKEHREPEENSQSTAARVIGQWLVDPKFTTKGRKPKVLAFGGEESEFKDLVVSVNRHLSPKTVLMDLERLGYVERTSRGLKLLSEGDINLGDESKRVSLLSRNIETLIDASQSNLDQSDHIGHLHGRTEYDNVLVGEVDKIRKWLLKEGKAFHRKARNLISKYDCDVNPKKGAQAGAKIVLSSFSMSYPPNSEKKD